mmetsp:Transcript_11150/g.22502  ORF Transcript_11150/g.22502 Transcript_11150/m.22502 type:complete len:216 (-) Transcript_11150:376-1023(-)
MMHMLGAPQSRGGTSHLERAARRTAAKCTVHHMVPSPSGSVPLLLPASSLLFSRAPLRTSGEEGSSFSSSSPSLSSCSRSASDASWSRSESDPAPVPLARSSARTVFLSSCASAPMPRQLPSTLNQCRGYGWPLSRASSANRRSSCSASVDLVCGAPTAGLAPRARAFSCAAATSASSMRLRSSSSSRTRRYASSSDKPRRMNFCCRLTNTSAGC